MCCMWRSLHLWRHNLRIWESWGQIRLRWSSATTKSVISSHSSQNSGGFIIISGRLSDMTLLPMCSNTSGRLCDLTSLHMGSDISGRLCDLTSFPMGSDISSRLCDVTLLPMHVVIYQKESGWCGLIPHVCSDISCRMGDKVSLPMHLCSDISSSLGDVTF